jgi:hypothetical protein
MLPVLKVLEVTVIYDDTIWPPGPKMVVCIEPELGVFFRINSRPNWQTPVKLEREPEHKFLQRDNYMECSEPLELDDYIIEQALTHGVVGRISRTKAPEICAAVAKAIYISAEDKEKIRVALGC